MSTKCCPIMYTLSMVGGKWKFTIVKELLAVKSMRSGELLRSIPGISRKVLTENLRELEEDGIISRIDFHEKPLHVEYSLTELGVSLISILKEIRRWGMFNLLNNEKKPIRCLECKQCQSNPYGC